MLLPLVISLDIRGQRESYSHFNSKVCFFTHEFCLFGKIHRLLFVPPYRGFPLAAEWRLECFMNLTLLKRR